MSKIGTFTMKESPLYRNGDKKLARKQKKLKKTARQMQDIGNRIMFEKTPDTISQKADRKMEKYFKTKKQIAEIVDSKVMSPLNNDDPKYKKGDLLDETDWETHKYKSTSEGKNYVRHNIQDVSEVQEDDKGQFVTTLGDDEITPSLQENPIPLTSSTIMPNALRPNVRIARDTIRPIRGKNFKGY